MRRHTRRRFLGLAGAAAAAMGLPRTAAAAAEASKTKLPFELGLASYTTRSFSLDETIRVAQRLDLKHLCLKSMHLPLESTPEECAAAAAKCREAGLDLYGCGVVTMKEPAQVDQAFDYAKAAGMRVIVSVPYPEMLPLVNQKVKQYDIAVAIHNHGPEDKVYPTPAVAYEKIKDLDPRVGLCIDVGHTLRAGEDPAADARRFADRLLDLHIKDVSAADAKGNTIEAGRGVLDIAAVLKSLVEVGYSRVVSFEYEKDGNDPLLGLAESVGYVRGLLAML